MSSPSCVNFINVPIPMRDGVKLMASVYLPALDNKKYGVLISRSPYGASTVRDAYAIGWCGRGYAYVAVDTRGRFQSDGVCDPGRTELEDGYDTAEWIVRQTWSNGRIFILGGSYVGVTTLSALASGHPAYVGGSPSAITSSWYETFYTNGVLELSFMMPWYLGMCCRNADRKVKNEYEWKKMLPVCDFDDFAGTPAPQWKRIVDHPNPECDFWKQNALSSYAAGIKAPMFIRTSYFDLLGRYGYRIYTDLMAHPDVSDHFKKHSFLIIGPWGHGVNTPEGHYVYGDDSMIKDEDEEFDFMAACLDERAPGTDALPGRVRYFTMIENKWHYAQTFPPDGTTDIPFYFNSEGRANTAKGDGILSRNAVACVKTPDRFSYDPANPVPTCGGRMVGSGGQRDQSEVEARQDVLSYTSAPLADDLNVTGLIRAKLFVSSSAPDTDFTLKLVDIQADGTPYNVCDTIVRVRWSHGFDRPRFLEKDEVRELAFDVDFTSYLFRKGNRLRVDISSSNFPHYERNLNMGTDNVRETHMQTAHQTVFHDPEHPSQIILPVFN